MREDLRETLEETLAYMEAQNTIIKAIDRELQPYWPRKREIELLLIESHDWISGKEAVSRNMPHADIEKSYVVGLHRENAPLRQGLFTELDRLALIFGPTRERRRVAQLEADAAQRAADRIREILAKPPPKPKPRPVTGDLFRGR